MSEKIKLPSHQSEVDWEAGSTIWT